MTNVQMSFLDELPISAPSDTVLRQPYTVQRDDAERQRIEAKFAPLLQDEPHLGKLVSYVGNKSVPLLRLFRYKEAFAYSFVGEFIKRLALTHSDYLFDPFNGMGTTLYTAVQHNIPAIGIDKLPIGPFVTQTLPLFYQITPGTLFSAMQQMQKNVNEQPPALVAMDVAIMRVAFPPEQMHKLRQWKTAISKLESPLCDIFTLLWLAVLESCSYTTKDGQFLRLREDKILIEPATAMWRKVQEAEDDVRAVQMMWDGLPLAQQQVYVADARDLSNVPFAQPPTAIITSPPYVNRYDYTRSYSLELAFQFVDDFAALKRLRFGILRSHIEVKTEQGDAAKHPVVKEVVDILRRHSEALNNARIPDMVTAYFVDMEQVISEWARVLTAGARVVMVVGNVRFEGEHLPVDLILSEIAESYGFRVDKIIVARYKGNSSQQMGKYGRMPVRESVLVWTKSIVCLY